MVLVASTSSSNAGKRALLRQISSGYDQSKFHKQRLDRAFSDLFFRLKQHPQGSRNRRFRRRDSRRSCNSELTSTQIAQLQKSFPVTPSVDFNKLSQDQILREVAKITSLKQFDEFTKQVDQEKGIEQPVPPLLLAAGRGYPENFGMHPNVVPTEELKAKLLGLLKANSKFNSSNESLPVLNQHLDSALDFLLQSRREVEVYLEPKRSHIWRYALGSE